MSDLKTFERPAEGKREICIGCSHYPIRCYLQGYHISAVKKCQCILCLIKAACSTICEPRKKLYRDTAGINRRNMTFPYNYNGD